MLISLVTQMMGNANQVTYSSLEEELFPGLVKKKSCVAESTMEAEYIACSAILEAVRIKRIS